MDPETRRGAASRMGMALGPYHGGGGVSTAGLAACLAVLAACAGAPDATWHGLVVADEARCSPYRAADYRYPQSVELEVIAAMGGRIYGPYTGRTFADRRQTDIEHIVARSEAHDSGLCAADRGTRGRFAADPLNLTLAAPEVNRCGGSGKCAKDAAEWLPERNACWFAARIVQVRRKYRLTVDRREADSLERALSGCTSTGMVFHGGPVVGTAPARPPAGGPPAGGPPDALGRWDDNGNGRITCSEARRHGIAPVRRGHPAYPFMRDGNDDGVVCN